MTASGNPRAMKPAKLKASSSVRPRKAPVTLESAMTRSSHVAVVPAAERSRALPCRRPPCRSAVEAAILRLLLWLHIGGCAMRRTIRGAPAALAGLLLTGAAAIAATPPQFPDARATDPNALGWMVGAPPPPEKLIRYDDGSFYRFPQWRWSFSNWR